MSFIYYKRSKKEKLQFWRKISKVDVHEVIFAHHAKIWHTLQKFGTSCESLAHLAKIWHTLPKFGTPCQILAYLAKLMFLPCEMLCFPPFAIDSFGNPFPSLPRGFEVLQSLDSSCAPNSPSILACFSDPKRYQKH